MKKKKIIAAIAIGYLFTIMCGFFGWLVEHHKVSTLESEINALQKQEKRSAIIRSVSKQMEDIAYEQKTISDEQREEALKQKHEADAAKELAQQQQREALRQKVEADEAKELAEKKSREALHEKLIAEQQRQVADEKTAEARKLNYLSLGRLLGTKSLYQYQAGNRDIATCLAYAAYKFTKENGSEEDLYDPAVLRALMAVSDSKKTFDIHKGAIMGIDFMAESNKIMASVSTYGEVFLHERMDDHLKTEKLFSNSDYDFRHVYMNKQKTIYAVSRSGHLVTIMDGTTNVTPITGIENPFYILVVGDSVGLVAGSRGMARINLKTFQQTDAITFNFNVVSVNRTGLKLYLFDDHGMVHSTQEETFGKVVTMPLPKGVRGTVTAFAYSRPNDIRAYGTNEGIIYLVDGQGRIKELVGHRSRVTRIKFLGERLYSSSYDGVMNMWLFQQEKVDPMQLFDSGAWIMYFAVDHSLQHIWTGDQNGNMTETIVDIPLILQNIRKNLRNMTPDEWDTYIGKEYPYESFADDGKEVIL